MSRKLVASFFTLEEEYQSWQAEELRSAAELHGFEVEILDAEGNGVLQIQQLFHLIHAPEEERPVAFLVQTRIPEGLERVARNALAAGIGWVLLNRTAPYVETLRHEYPRSVVSAVMADHDEIGRIQGRQFRALLPSGGSVLYVQGPAHLASAQSRLEAMQAGIAGADIEVKVVPADWTEASGEKAVGAWLRLKTSERFKPDLVGCQNDALAVGARKALQGQRPEWAGVPFTGCDGLPEGGQRLVNMKQLVATIVIAPCGTPAVGLVDRVLASGELPPAVVVVPPRSFPPVEALGASKKR